MPDQENELQRRVTTGGHRVASREVDLLAERAARSGNSQRAGELQSVAAHLRHKEAARAAAARSAPPSTAPAFGSLRALWRRTVSR